MKLTSFLFFSFFLISHLLIAQSDSLLLVKKAEETIGISDAELIDFLMVSMPGKENAAAQSLKYQSVKTYMMPPRNTDETGNAKCYVLTAAAEYYVNFNENYKVNLSPDYIHLSLPVDNFSEALTFMVKNGTVSADIMPYGAKFIPPTVRATQKYTLQNYLYLFRQEANARQKIFAVRKALMRGNPVIVEMQVPQGFADLNKVNLYNKVENTEKESLPFLLVGYNEDEKTVEISGAYGSNWGLDGYLNISYDDFSEMALRGYVLVPR